MSDGWEITYRFDPHNAADAGGDPDNDNLTNLEEFENGANPTLVDTDGDGLNDGDEVKIHGTDPTLADSDGDGVGDSDEINTFGTNPIAKDTDGDGISDYTDTAPKYNFQYFADSDGDGISDSIDSDPNTSRGAAPTISSSTGSSTGDPGLVVDSITGEKLHFHLNVANPAGMAPIASQIKFLLDGEETPVDITDLGRGRFVLTWTSDVHVGYPDKIAQLATARFTDNEGATAYYNFATIDVAEWEGMIAGLPSGKRFSSWRLQVKSRHHGKDASMTSICASNQGHAEWYRGTRQVPFYDIDTGEVRASGKIGETTGETERVPLFMITKSEMGAFSVAPTLDLSEGASLTGQGVFYNNHSSSEVKSMFEPGGTLFIPSGETKFQAILASGTRYISNLGVKISSGTGGNEETIAETVWPRYSDKTVWRIFASVNLFDSSHERISYEAAEVRTKVMSRIIPHRAGTLDFPSLPMLGDFPGSKASYLPMASEEWHKIVLKVSPDVVGISSGLEIKLYTGAYADNLMEPGFECKRETEFGHVAFPIPTNGTIAIAPGSETHQQLVSEKGLILFLKHSPAVTKLHRLSLRYASKLPEIPNVELGEIHIMPTGVALVELTENGEMVAQVDPVIEMNTSAPQFDFSAMNVGSVTEDDGEFHAELSLSGNVQSKSCDAVPGDLGTINTVTIAAEGISYEADELALGTTVTKTSLGGSNPYAYPFLGGFNLPATGINLTEGLNTLTVSAVDPVSGELGQATLAFDVTRLGDESGIPLLSSAGIGIGVLAMDPEVVDSATVTYQLSGSNTPTTINLVETGAETLLFESWDENVSLSVDARSGKVVANLTVNNWSLTDLYIPLVGNGFSYLGSIAAISVTRRARMILVFPRYS